MAISVSFPFSWCCSTWDPGTHSAGCWLTLPHLVTNWSDLQTNWLPVFTELYNSSITHSVSPHNWLSECITSTVPGMACLIVIKRKQLSCSSQVTNFWCICLWLYRGILPCSILSAKSAYAISPHNWSSECVTSAVFGMACLAGSKVNIQQEQTW